MFANSSVQANIFNPDQTAPKRNGSLQYCMLFTFPLAMFHLKNKYFSDLSSIQCLEFANIVNPDQFTPLAVYDMGALDEN